MPIMKMSVLMSSSFLPLGIVVGRKKYSRLKRFLQKSTRGKFGKSN